MPAPAAIATAKPREQNSSRSTPRRFQISPGSLIRSRLISSDSNKDRSFAVDQGASEPAAAALEHEFKLDQYYRYQLERPTNRGEGESHAAVPLSLLHAASFSMPEA
jgi:hypothetical protein